VNVHVAFTPDEAAAAPTGIVIDVLRATSTIAQALAAGYERVLCVAEIEQAELLRAEIPDSIVGGERDAIKIEGFDVGASPREFLDPRARTLILSTTNGTRTIVTAAERCDEVLLGSLLNLDAVAAAARAGGEDVAILCAGYKGAFALDDAYCAGRLVAATLGDARARRGINDAGIASLDLVRRYGERWERPLSCSRAGRQLIRLGFRDDVLDAARLDAYPVPAHFHERRVTLVPVPV
jgi:2-phosphosulfolactate phosphatase